MRITGKYHLVIKQNTLVTHFYASSALHHARQFATDCPCSTANTSVTVALFMALEMLVNTTMHNVTRCIPDFQFFSQLLQPKWTMQFQVHTISKDPQLKSWPINSI